MKITIIGGTKSHGRHGNALRLALAEAAYYQENNTILQRALWTDQPTTPTMPAYSAWTGWN